MNRFARAEYYTRKYKSLLQPCKHCGNTDIRVVSDRSIFPAKDVWFVCCTTEKCDCTRSYTRIAEAVKAWNRRADDDR